MQNFVLCGIIDCVYGIVGGFPNIYLKTSENFMEKNYARWQKELIKDDG